MFNGMNTKEHYKMYKKGKAWVFAGIVTATLALGVAGGQTAHADTTGDSASEQESASNQSATPAKEVTLTQKTAEDATSTATVSDATKSSETSNTDEQSTDTTKPSEEVTVDGQNADTTKTSGTTATDAKMAVTPTMPGKPADTTPVTETDKTSDVIKDVTDTTKKSITKVTTAVTPDMKIQAPTRAKMKHTARMMAPAEPTTQTPTATPAVTAVTPVAEADESIDQWMPNKTLQKMVFWTLNNGDFGRTWNSPANITQKDMLLLTSLSTDNGKISDGTWYSTYIDGKTSFSLEGLQYAQNLTSLDLVNSLNINPVLMRGDITDLSPLSTLGKLTSLQFTNNRVSDITPITGLKNITSLSMANNDIEDFSTLNPSQYTGGVTLNDQLVVKDPVYIDTTGKFSIVDPVKAPQGQTFTYTEGPGNGSAIVVSPILAQIPILRLYYKGATSTKDSEGVIHYQVIQNQIMPGPSSVAQYPEYKVLQNDYTFYLISQYLDDGGYEMVTTFTPYIIANHAKDITVKYVDENGKSLAEDETLSGLVGESYTATPKKFTGYTLTATPANATGTFSDTAQTVTFVYKEAVSTVTVHYQDDQGATIKPDETETGKVGDTYTIDHPAISGYTYKETVGDATGTYTDTPTEVTFIYTKDTVTPPVTPSQNVTVTVHYQTSDGTQVAPDVVITGKTGDTYMTSPATNISDGYELVTTPANATGTMGDSDITVTYVYAETGGGGDQVNPGPDKPTKPTTPTKPTKPTTEPDKVAPTKPAKQPAKGGQADRITTGKRTPAKGGAATTVALTAKPNASSLSSTNAKTTLPQTDEKTVSPLWGLAILGGLLGLAGLRKKLH